MKATKKRRVSGRHGRDRIQPSTSPITAIGNDYGFDLVSARQMEALGKEGDVAVGISTSGNSRTCCERWRSIDRGDPLPCNLKYGQRLPMPISRFESEPYSQERLCHC